MLFSRFSRTSLGRQPPVSPPTISEVSDRYQRAGSELSITLSCQVFDASTPQWRLALGPSEAVLTGNSPAANQATLVWTPEESDIDTDVTFSVTVSDSGGRTTTEDFVVSVVASDSTQLQVIRITSFDDPTNLTTDSVDWVMLARTSATDRDEKAGATEIGALSTVGNAVNPVYSSEAVQLPGLTWSDGSPTASGTNLKGARLQWSGGAPGKGVRFSVKMSETKARRLRVFAGAGVSAEKTDPAKITLKAWRGTATADVVSNEAIVLKADSYAPVVWDVEFPVGQTNEEVTVELVHTGSAGNWRIKGAALYESGSTDPAPGLSLDKELTVPVHEELVATLSYVSSDVSDVSLVADGLPDHAVFVDNGDATATFIYQSSVPPTSNPVATVSFRAMRGTDELARISEPVTLTAKVLDPPVISWAGTNWPLSRNSYGSKNVAVDRGTMTMVSAPGSVVYYPAWGASSAQVGWSPTVAGQYEIVFEAVDDKGRRATRTLPIQVS